MSKKYWFVSGEYATSSTGATVNEAWQKILERTDPIPAWLRTDTIKATTHEGRFIKLVRWPEAISTETCGMCGGIGAIIEPNFTEEAGEWHSDPCDDTCPECDGSGRVSMKSLG